MRESSSRRWPRASALCLSTAAFLLFPFLSVASPKTEINKELFGLELTDLSKLTITSVSKKKQQLSKAASAVFVLTSEDIQRSGYTSIPELLRLVPGVQVARTSGHTWNISIRGWRDLFANKLLVLIDGRSVYTPLFSGVYWDVQDVVLEDIERIEVIRGPGATVWGANAVNGVINIITKAASETQDSMVSFGGGNEDLGQAFVRHGFKLDETTSGRVYAKAIARDGLQRRDAGGVSNGDSGEQYRAGFRLDRALEEGSLTLQGDAYTGIHRENLARVSLTEPFLQFGVEGQDVGGANLLGKYERIVSEDSEFFVQAYYDYIERFGYDLGQRRHTFDLEAQHQYKLAPDLDLVWGGGYRVFQQETTYSTFNAEILENPETFDVFSAFGQIERTIFDGKGQLTIGSKISHNDLSGFEVQPSVRGRVSPDDSTDLWFAVSRAVRTPSIFGQYGRLAGGVFPGEPGERLQLLTILGQPDYDSEDLLAYEVGSRHRLSDSFTLDIALFWNEYDDVRTAERKSSYISSSPQPTHTLLPRVFDNRGELTAFGGEIAIAAQPTEWWRIRSSYQYVNIDTALDADSTDESLVNKENESPEHEVTFRSFFSLGRDVQLDPILRYVDYVKDDSVGSYVELDLHLGIRLSESWSFDVTGYNLLNPHHYEAPPAGRALRPTQVERSVFGRFKIKL